MGRRKMLEKRLARLMAKKESLKARALASEDANEVRGINETLSELNEDIDDVKDEIETLPTEEDEDVNLEGRSAVPTNAVQVNHNVLASFNGTAPVEQRADEDLFATMEYRTAFKDYVQKGTPIPAKFSTRAGGDAGVTMSEDIGAIIPTTTLNELIREVSKVYGNLYAKVRKLNVKGGIKFPIEKLKASFKWVAEGTVSDEQKAGDIKEYVEFTYNLGEIRIATTLLASIVSLEVFESEVVRVLLEAYVEAMDKSIVSGTGAGQPLGILNDPRVTNVVEFTEADFVSWDKWRKNLFAKIPLSKRGKGEFIFTAATVESNLLTMKDKNDRPLFYEATGLAIAENATKGRFYGREVELVEPDIIADFDTAVAGDVVGIYWVPSDYAINTNLAFGVKHYFDESKNEWIDKGLTIVDGKILDTSGCYLIKKK